MILKEREGTPPSDMFGRAGYEAEKQMAFYLRRAFAESPDVFVFNDLRFVRRDEVAQIDHLVLHRFGFFLIESKSVTGSIEVNRQLEFVRVYRRQRTGMKSPITQVKMQTDLLKNLLNDNKESLRRKVALGFVQAYFGEERFEYLIAVSDRGEIKRKGCDPPELVKADRVTETIQKQIARRSRTQGVGGTVRMMFADKKEMKQMEEDYLAAFTDQELASIQDFLLKNHRPDVQPPPVVRETKVTAQIPPPPPKATRTFPPAKAEKTGRVCCHCESLDLEIVYGKYGYYFKCRSCSKNTRIDFTCCQCGKKAKISKKGSVFSWKCSECGNDSHFYTNPR